MTPTTTASSPTRLPLWTLALFGVFAVAFLLPTTTPLLHALRGLSIWVLLLALPGACCFRLLDRGRQSVFELALAGLIASPVLMTVIGIAVLSAGGSAANAWQAAAALSAALCVAAALVRRPRAELPTRRETVVLLLFTLGLLVLISTLPFTREWWRIRSDAWFHAAVTAQIRDYGLPPEDPYFVGMPLQYMWFYHVLLVGLSDALRVDSFWIMAFVNAHATIALVLAGYQFGAVLHPHFPHRFAAMATLVFGFNAAFWIFLPVKLVKSFIGDVRGMGEVARTFTLTPFEYNTVLGFTNIYFNQEFFLDKFMVATAFGMALVFLISAWAGAVDYLHSGRRYGLALFAFSLVGMLGFHSLVGFVFLVGAVGGAVLLHLTRARVDGYRTRAGVVLVAVSVLCFLAMTPYLYHVMHAKEREHVFPINFGFRKTAGILISSAFVIVVASRARWFWSDRSVATRFLALSAALVTAFCFSIHLPGPNTYDKLGYFVFVPFAIVAGFAIADSVLARTGRARWTAMAAWILLFFAPLNVLTFASCFATPDAVQVTPAEARLSAWVRENTAREAVFIDDQDRVPLLVTGPRRYFWGNMAYAEQWGYPRAEMTRRYHVVEALYRSTEVDAAALRSLASIEEPLFVVVRPEHAGRAVANHPDLFQTVYDDGEIALARVDRDACRARSGP
ncbi:MAG: hypothetical protein L0Z51_09330 [Candidatus Latescibacteria bacterium]|nr:hypothetical protein [Candidatus Latescibacterota bacterium]